MPPVRTASAKLEPETAERLRKLAATRRRDPYWLMKEAIEQYVDREEKRQSFHEDAAEAWSRYRADGLHLTAAEADDWLRRLADGEDADPPACHD